MAASANADAVGGVTAGRRLARVRRAAPRARVGVRDRADALLAHPLLVVALASAVVALAHAVWIWQHRHLGAYDPDEAGYIATALRFEHRVSLTAPLAVPIEVARTGSGPLVPLISAVLLLVGPEDPRTALLAQPLLLVVTSVAAAGIARRLAGPGAAVTAGLALLGLQTMVSATQSYWLGLGAAAALTCALWALVASDRLTNRWAYAYGAGVAAMLLARTMTLGFLPAALLAGVVVAGRDRAAWKGLAKAVAVVAVGAGPWYVVEWRTISGYLFSYGYGERAGLFGPGGFPGRVDSRIDRVAEGVGVGLPIAVGLLVVAAVVAGVRALRSRPEGTGRSWHARLPDLGAHRDAVAVAATVAVGVAALLSTSNKGVWFELPLITVAVPLVVALAAGAPALLRGLGAAVVAVAAGLQLACALWLVAPGPDAVPFVSDQGRVAHYEFGFEQYDVRFGPGRRDELPRAAADWWALSEDVTAELHRLDRQAPLMATISGSFQLFNTNTVALAGELDGWTVGVHVPDTVQPDARRAADLTPDARRDGDPVRSADGGPVERVLVLALHDQHLFTPDAEVQDLAEQAEAAGWRAERRFPIPGGGDVVLYRHPDGRAGG